MDRSPFLCLWNAESKIVVECCLLVIRTAFSVEGPDVLKKKWHTHMHTHIHIDQNSLWQCLNCVTVFTVDWLQEQEEVLKVKYWLYSWERSKQAEWKAQKRSVKIRLRHPNRLQTVTDTEQDTLCNICGQSLTDDCFWCHSSKQQTHKNCAEIVGPAVSCVVISVNVLCEPVMILNGNISLLCLGLTAEIANIQNKTFHVLVSLHSK